MKQFILPLLQAIIGLSIGLLGVIFGAASDYGLIVGLALGIVGLLVCVTAYLRAKGLLAESEKSSDEK